MTQWWVENLSDWPQIVHGPFFYINPEFETGGAGIWKKKLNLGTPNGQLKNSILVWTAKELALVMIPQSNAAF